MVGTGQTRECVDGESAFSDQGSPPCRLLDTAGLYDARLLFGCARIPG